MTWLWALGQALGDQILTAAESSSEHWLIPVIVAAITAFGAICVALAGLAGNWSGRRAANQTAEANAVAVQVKAEADVQDAFTRAHEAARKEWGFYAEKWQRYAEQQADDLAEVRERLAKLEVELIAYRRRATRAEDTLDLSITYLHRIAAWVTEQLPGATLPPPPPELEPHLRRDRST